MFLPSLVLLSPAALAAEPVPATVYKVPDASGIPVQSCSEALGLVPKPKPPPDRPLKPSHATGEPDLHAMPRITVGGQEFDPRALPGGDPDSLPVRSLEGPDEVIARVGEVMLAMERGERVRISFFGASHTGGDFWTGHIRRILQRRHGDIGHGFVFPAALYNGYRGQDINLCRSDAWFADYVGKRDGRSDSFYGFAGASVSSSDAGQFGWLETTHSNPEGRKVSRYELFTLGQPEGGSLLVQVDEADPIKVSTKTEAHQLLRHRFEVPDGPHRFKLSPTGVGEVRIFGVSAERAGPGVLVDAMGIRGRTANTWLSWDRTMAAQGLASLDPDMVVLAYGTNEANDMNYTLEQYEKDLDAVLAELRKATPEVACVLAGPSDRGKKLDDDTFAVWDRTDEFAAVQRKVAPKHGCAFWDWQLATGGAGSMIAWNHLSPPLAAGDLIHFTNDGYKKSGDLFVAALDEAAELARRQQQR